MIDIKAIREAAEAATQGGWITSDNSHIYSAGLQLLAVAQHCRDKGANAKHIATANPATVLALCDEVERLTSCLKKANAQAEMDKLGVPRDDGEDFYSLWGRVGRLLAVRTSPAPVQEQQPVAWEVVHKAVCDAAEKCKFASGMHGAIEMYVNDAQITHDAPGTDTATQNQEP